MKTFLFAAGSFLCAFSICAQNLVLNPGFEILQTDKYQADCRFSQRTYQFNESAAYWNSFNGLTPDLISYPDSADCVFPKPFAGKNMLGFINFYPAAQTGWLNDYHEFVQGQLSEPLVEGVTYEVRFWVNRQVQAPLQHLKTLPRSEFNVPPVPVASNNIGIAFLRSPADPNEFFDQSVRQFGIRPHFNVDTIVGDSAMTWMQVKGTFKAPFATRHFVIGNFFKDAHTDVNFEPSPYVVFPVRIAYYCLDELYIGPAGSDLEEALTQTGRYTFRSVHFPTASAALQPEAFPELDTLAGYLARHPEIQAKIAGHTDNVGQAEDNQILSERRAGAVRQYLIGQGIDDSRITYQGYGESQPVAGNGTAEGRQQNRRVECVLK
ncbi:MAG: OmpA family protein [Phaeodactylibacter sp.]|uniref:OmpA family protein n=1 Tax=Phaeodactylibacter sp. TaxID=1940289 RepID=UPI0032F0111F